MSVIHLLELDRSDISALNDADLRELVARLCEAELSDQGISPACVLWGGAQEAPDGGLDVRVTNAINIDGLGFIPRENVGLQVKKNSMAKAACKKEMHQDGSVRPVILDLAKCEGAYIIVSGTDDCSESMLNHRRCGMHEAVVQVPGKSGLLLDFYGRDRLAAWLRQHPAVSLWARSRLGKPLSGWAPFGRWAATPTQHADKFLSDDHPCVVDASSNEKEPVSVIDGIELTRSKLRQSHKSVRITGLSGVGKTRFAQALFETGVGERALPAMNAIYADLGDNLSPSATEFVSYMIASHLAGYVVLDNCPQDVHRKLQKQLSDINGRLRLLTIEYDISDDRPEETEVIHLEPKSESTNSQMVQERFPELGIVNADKVAEFAGGNARLAIALASRVDADDTLSNFSDDDLFQKLFYQRKKESDQLLEGAEILSLVYSFNVAQSRPNNEVVTLAAIGGLDPKSLNRCQAELLRRQLAQRRGDWRAVLPHALANRLARRALENIAPGDINRELLKKENTRLFKSCAHRLGYLHDFEPARALATSWTHDGGPLCDLASCNAETLSAFTYVAPVFPEAALKAMETASNAPDFASRKNPNFSLFVRLLGRLAYEDQYFTRATQLMLRFAETERPQENVNCIINDLSGLFSMRISGTQAKPETRVAVLGRLLETGEQRNLEIARELFNSALEAFQWTSTGGFEFGAHKRDHGWEPRKESERLGWYLGFIDLLRPALCAPESTLRNFAKSLLANNFRGLWSFGGCFDVLEEITHKHAIGGSWPELWVSIKQTINFDGKHHSEALLKRLKKLEHISAPADFVSEIEAYAFANTWDHVDAQFGSYGDQKGNIYTKIIGLGEKAATVPDLLDNLGVRFWNTQVDGLGIFGEGLAKGSPDPESTFEHLLSLMQKRKLSEVQPILLEGFIRQVYLADPSLARKLQERSLEITELKPHSVYFLAATPIAPWATQRLLQLARDAEIETWRFEQIKYGRVHETISDSDLTALLLELNKQEEGLFTTIGILGMRFLPRKSDQYVPDENLRAVGRAAILKLLSMHRSEIRQHERIHELELVLDQCICDTAPTNEIRSLVNSLCDGIQSYRLYGFELANVISTLTKRFPEVLLNHIFSGKYEEKFLLDSLFRLRLNRTPSALNSVSFKRLIKWCGGDQSRILKLSASVSPYTFVEKETGESVEPNEVQLSDHIKAFLEVSNEKAQIMETILENSSPSSWSGSRATMMRTRSIAFSELLEHSSAEIRKLAAAKLELLNDYIQRVAARETDQDSLREQRFE